VTPLLLSRGPAAALLTLAAGLTGCSSASGNDTRATVPAAPSSATVAGPAPVLGGGDIHERR
jgi:hypothetical protein